jgi:hypothetical protein
MPRKALLKAVTERGIILSGKDPGMVLSTMMWRMRNEFVGLPRWGYWLKDRPYEPAEYHPLVPYPADDEHSEIVNPISPAFCRGRGNDGERTTVR